MSEWISVRNWRKHQHYDPAKRQPPWIKVYTELTSDEAYLALTARARCLLHGVWLEYAQSKSALRADVTQLNNRLRMRATHADLVSLCDAGFIELVASKTLADGYHGASTALASRARAHSLETETETEEEQDQSQEPSFHPSVAKDPQAEPKLEANNGRTAGISEQIDFQNVLKKMPV